MKKIYLTKIGLLFIMALQVITCFGQNDTTIKAKFINTVTLFDTTSFSSPDFSSDSALNNLLENYNVSYFAPYCSNNVINLDLRNYYSISFEGIVADFIADLENLNLTTEVEMNLPDTLLCSSPVAINDERIFWNWSNNDALVLADAQCAWSITTGNPDIRIAIADTDFDEDHEDLIGQIREVYGPISANHPHGTEIMGIAGAKPNTIGIVGAGYNLKWDGSRVQHTTFLDGQGNLQASGSPNNAITAAINKGARVINVSWSITGFSTTEMQDIIDQGVIVIVAAGNTPGSLFHQDIADIPGVIMVSGVNKYGYHGPTNHAHNSMVELCAVSTGVTTLRPNDEYFSSTGTSSAAPQVAATAGLILSLNPCFSPAQVEEIITSTTKPIADASSFPGTVGTGYLDMYEAVKFAAGRSGTLTSNETWSSLHIVGGKLIVPNGKILTITSTVLFYNNGSIYVQPGGKLIIDGGLLTSVCESWEGIRIEGNSSLNQSGNNQGRLELIDATIEHARIAVSLSGLKSTGDIDYSKLGGIIISDNSHFINNKKDVEFFPYHPILDGMETNNISSFLHTDFITDHEYRYSSDNQPHVTMWDVNGVSFLGCLFSDNRTGVSPKTDGRTGIHTVSANYLVTNYCPVIYPCSEDPSQFLNLKNAIQSYRQGSYGNTNISNSEFNCYKGIYLQGMDNSLILSNIFTIAHDLVAPGLTAYPYGLYLDKCQGFNTENNTFNGTTGAANVENGGAAGMVIRNTGPNNNTFYRSFFNNLKMGTQVLGENRQSGAAVGLRFRCNEYDENYHDVYIRDHGNSINIGQTGMAELQGQRFGNDPLNPDNLFGNSSAILARNILNGAYLGEDKWNWIQYTYSGTATQGNRLYPYSTTSKVVLLPFSSLEDCPDNLAEGPNDRTTITGNLEGIGPMMTDKADEWVVLTDGGNTESLVNDIVSADNFTVPGVFVQLITASPYLSNEVLALVAEQGAPFTAGMILDVMLANPHSARSGWVQTNLDNNTSIVLSLSYRDSINDLTGVFTGRDTLGAELAALSEEYDRNLSELIHSHLSDTAYTMDSISAWLKHPLNPTYHYQLAEMYFDIGEWSNYEDVVDSIPLKFNLNGRQETYHNAFTDLFDQLHVWQVADTNIYSPDSVRLAWLLDYAENNPADYPVKLHALLAVNDTFINQHDVYIDEEEEEEGYPVTTNSAEDLKMENEKSSVSIYPNPGRNEVNLEWKEGFVPSKVKVFDINGRLVSEYDWNKKGELTIQVGSWPSGTYIVQIVTDKSEKVIRKLLITK